MPPVKDPKSLRALLDRLASWPTVIRPEGQAVFYEEKDGTALEAVLTEWAKERNRKKKDSVAVLNMPSEGTHAMVMRNIAGQLGAVLSKRAPSHWAEMEILHHLEGRCLTIFLDMDNISGLRTRRDRMVVMRLLVAIQNHTGRPVLLKLKKGACRTITMEDDQLISRFCFAPVLFESNKDERATAANMFR